MKRKVNMQPQEIFGFIAGAIGIYMAVPQALHIRKVGHGTGVSLGYWIILLFVNASWTAYALLVNSPSILFANGIGYLTSAMVVAALVKNNVIAWPVMLLAGAGWVWAFMKLPMSVIGVVLVVLTFSRIPQIIRSVRSYRAGISTAVSMRSQYIGLFTMLLWEGYSFASGLVQLVVTTTVGLTLTLTVLILELLGKRKAARLSAIELVDGPQVSNI
ncbi:MAG: hypothetical protein RJA35_538 [Actinomycetota bacterium]